MGPARWAGWTTCVVAACVGLALIARSGEDAEFGVGVVVALVSHVLLGLVVYAGPGALDARQYGVRLRATLRPAAAALAVETVVGWLLFPVSHPDDEPDWSWLALVPLLTLVLGSLAVLASTLVWVLLVAPVAVLSTRSVAAARGDLRARQLVLLSALLLTIVVLALAVAPADPSDDRANIVRLVGLLIGLQEPVPGRGWLLWIARADAVVMGLAVVGLVRTHRAMRARGLDPDAVGG